jgi:nucleoside 2-deoxyribosyltransferase
MNKLKIYFAGSIRGGREDAALYFKTIRELQEYGEVLTEHVGDDTLLSTGERNLSDKDIHDRDLGWITTSDIVIAEVSTPSLGVGYEIAYALSLGKQICCLFNAGKGRRLSAMIRGSRGLTIIDYQDFNEIKKTFKEIFGNNLRKDRP